MIYMNETARRSLMNFGDNVINIDLDFLYLFSFSAPRDIFPFFRIDKVDMLCHIKGGEMDKRTNELAMVVKDTRAVRDSFEP